MSTLPILIPGCTEPVNVPCQFGEDAFTFNVFLPNRGIRKFVAWVTTRDLAQMEVDAVGLSDNEPTPHLRASVADALSVTEDEQRRADEAAADVLAGVLWRLGLGASRAPIAARRDGVDHDVLPAIARAYEAEVAAYVAQQRAHEALPRRLQSIALLPDNPSTPESTWLPPSRTMLASYVEWCFEDAQKAQADKARRQAEEWARENTGDEAPSGSEAGRF